MPFNPGTFDTDPIKLDENRLEKLKQDQITAKEDYDSAVDRVSIKQNIYNDLQQQLTSARKEAAAISKTFTEKEMINGNASLGAGINKLEDKVLQAKRELFQAKADVSSAQSKYIKITNSISDSEKSLKVRRKHLDPQPHLTSFSKTPAPTTSIAPTNTSGNSPAPDPAPAPEDNKRFGQG